MKKMLITGAAGFIGHFLVKQFFEDYKLICVVRPNGNLRRLKDVNLNVKLIEHNLREEFVHNLDDIEVILHAGGNPSSESSINDPFSVVMDNVIGTANMLEFAKKLPNLKRFVYYGAAESYGPSTPGTDKYENDPYDSVSPYAASKAGGAELCVAYSKTFNLPVSIINIANTFGERSQKNRLPVIAINKIMNEEEVLIVSDGYQISGRKWQHVEDVALHTRFILNNQKQLCEKWNSAHNSFTTNLGLCQMIARSLGKPLKVKFVEPSRNGHGILMTINSGKIYNQWKNPYTLQQRIQQTVKWYTNNKEWL